MPTSLSGPVSAFLTSTQQSLFCCSHALWYLATWYGPESSMNTVLRTSETESPKSLSVRGYLKPRKAEKFYALPKVLN